MKYFLRSTQDYFKLNKFGIVYSWLLNLIILLITIVAYFKREEELLFGIPTMIYVGIFVLLFMLNLMFISYLEDVYIGIAEIVVMNFFAAALATIAGLVLLIIMAPFWDINLFLLLLVTILQFFGTIPYLVVKQKEVEGRNGK